jgi:hypothetical protein
MKKNLFFAFFACVALAFVSCEEPVQPVEYSLTLNQTTVELEVGGSVKLNAIVSPAGEQVPVITWTSDNSEVAVVNASGIVEAIATGSATITATLNVEGVAPATCVVTVTNDAALNNFTLGGYGLFGSPEMIAGTDTTLALSDGDYQCQLGFISLYAWDDNIVYTGQGFSGMGFFFVADLPVWWITAGDFAGYYVGNSTGFYIDSVMTAYTAEAGQLVDLQAYGDGWNGILNATTQEEAVAAQELYFSSQTGTQVFTLDWSTGSQSFNYANVKYANIVDDDSLGLLFDLKFEWYDVVNDGYFYGLAYEEVITEAGDTTIVINEPYELRTINKEYSNMPIIEEEEETTETSALVPMKKNLYLGQDPMRYIKDTKVMYKK